MKLTVTKKVAFEVAYIGIDAAVRYEEEDMQNDAPLRSGEMWKAMVDVEAKKILDWPVGKTLKFYMKVCDEGVYTLYDKDKNILVERRDYVPNRLLPGEYGDYLELDIDENGNITNWLSHADCSNFEEEQD